ncbi:hypothetical protein SNEBB_002805 [Seison nebaliae]|nr:hypothetical protein SNEBB_002805 [Seison nebaliae]
MFRTSDTKLRQSSPNNVNQAILSLDARFNAIRFRHQPEFRQMYMKRRSLMIQKVCDISHNENGQEMNEKLLINRRKYFQLRKRILMDQYEGNRLRIENMDSMSLISFSSSQHHSSSLTKNSSYNRYSPSVLSDLNNNNNNNNKRRSEIDAIAMHSAQMMRRKQELQKIYKYKKYSILLIDDTINNKTKTKENDKLDNLFCITSIQFANTSTNLLAVSQSNGNIHLMDIEGKKELTHCGRLSGHSEEITCIRWSNANDFIISSSIDNTIRVWMINEMKCIRIIVDETKCVKDYAQEKSLKTAQHSHIYRKPISTSITFHQFTSKNGINCCSLFPDNNNLLICGNCTCHVQIYNISTGKLVDSLHLENSSKENILNVCTFSSIITDNILHWWCGSSVGYLYLVIINSSTGMILSTRTYSIYDFLSLKLQNILSITTLESKRCPTQLNQLRPMNNQCHQHQNQSTATAPYLLIGISCNAANLYRYCGLYLFMINNSSQFSTTNQLSTTKKLPQFLSVKFGNHFKPKRDMYLSSSVSPNKTSNSKRILNLCKFFPLTSITSRPISAVFCPLLHPPSQQNQFSSNILQSTACVVTGSCDNCFYLIDLLGDYQKSTMIHRYRLMSKMDENKYIDNKEVEKVKKEEDEDVNKTELDENDSHPNNIVNESDGESDGRTTDEISLSEITNNNSTQFHNTRRNVIVTAISCSYTEGEIITGDSSGYLILWKRSSN